MIVITITFMMKVMIIKKINTRITKTATLLQQIYVVIKMMIKHTIKIFYNDDIDNISDNNN